MSALAPCTSCRRHVRRSEVACPFCGIALALEPAPSLRVVSERLARAAIFAAAVTNVVGCSNSHTPENDAGSVIAAYGAPAFDAAALREDAGAPMTHYGAPPPIVDAAPAGDAGVDADPGCCNADYGAPPMP